ncbi:MAG: Acylphosphate phosphohydrolase, putative, partial [uncultured Actinomycetospora sp.]
GQQAHRRPGPRPGRQLPVGRAGRRDRPRSRRVGAQPRRRQRRAGRRGRRRRRRPHGGVGPPGALVRRGHRRRRHRHRAAGAGVVRAGM